MGRSVGWIVAAAAAASAGLLGLLLRAPPAAGGSPRVPAVVSHPVSGRVAPPPERPAVPPRPASLAGTDEDGRLTAGSFGELIVDEELRRFLEHHLTASGEEPLATTRARLEAAFAARLPPRAAREAHELLERYLALREAARQLTAAPDEDLDARLARVRSLRREHLGDAAATALFGAEEAEVATALARRRAAPGATMVASETDRAVTLPLATMRAEAAVAGEPRIHELRVQAFGAAGAERLAALDGQHAEWADRVARFRAQRAEIEASMPEEGARKIAVTRLLDTLFDPAERVRVSALERLAGRPLD